jgi:hypothetical protein
MPPLEANAVVAASASDDHTIGEHSKSSSFHSPDDRLADARFRVR